MRYSFSSPITSTYVIHKTSLILVSAGNSNYLVDSNKDHSQAISKLETYINPAIPRFNDFIITHLHSFL